MKALLIGRETSSQTFVFLAPIHSLCKKICQDRKTRQNLEGRTHSVFSSNSYFFVLVFVTCTTDRVATQLRDIRRIWKAWSSSPALGDEILFWNKTTLRWVAKTIARAGFPSRLCLALSTRICVDSRGFAWLCTACRGLERAPAAADLVRACLRHWSGFLARTWSYGRTRNKQNEIPRTERNSAGL